jgi:phosphate/sulfate permease
MFDLDLVAWSKIVAMLIFLPIYAGFLGYVFYKPNKSKLEAHGRIPFQED